MTNRLYKILKYIHRHPKSNRKMLLKKFPDIDSFSLHPYVAIDNQVDFKESQKESELILESKKLGMNVSQISEYITLNMPDYYDDTLVFYSTTTAFQEYLETRRRNFRSVWLTFCITTVIAITAIIAQFFKG